MTFLPCGFVHYEPDPALMSVNEVELENLLTHRDWSVRANTVLDRWTAMSARQRSRAAGDIDEDVRECVVLNEMRDKEDPQFPSQLAMFGLEMARRLLNEVTGVTE